MTNEVLEQRTEEGIGSTPLSIMFALGEVFWLMENWDRLPRNRTCTYSPILNGQGNLYCKQARRVAMIGVCNQCELYEDKFNGEKMRTREGVLVKKLPVVYDGIVLGGESMDIEEGMMYSIMTNPVVRIAYFFKDAVLHFMGREHEHKDYIVHAK